MKRWSTTDELSFLNRLGTGKLSIVKTSRAVLLKRYKDAFLKRDVYVKEGKGYVLNINKIIILEYLGANNA